MLHSNSDRLLRLINDLLDMSALDSGRMRLHELPVDVRALIDEVLPNYEHEAENREITLTVEAPSTPVVAWIDRARVGQVLANLIDNAIRFAPADSEVRVSSRRVARGVLVEVHNGGQPIPLDQVERVFDRFYQVDGARSTGRHRGLGLSIVQELVQAHGGTVSIESGAEVGTTVTFFLPTRGPGATAPRRDSAPQPEASPASVNASAVPPHLAPAEDRA